VNPLKLKENRYCLYESVGLANSGRTCKNQPKSLFPKAFLKVSIYRFYRFGIYLLIKVILLRTERGNPAWVSISLIRFPLRGFGINLPPREVNTQKPCSSSNILLYSNPAFLCTFSNSSLLLASIEPLQKFFQFHFEVLFR